MAHPADRIPPVAPSWGQRLLRCCMPCLSQQHPEDVYQAQEDLPAAAPRPLTPELQAPITAQPRAEAASTQPWANRLVTEARKMHLVGPDGKLSTEVLRNHTTGAIVREGTPDAVRDVALSGLLTALHNARHTLVHDDIESVTELMGFNTDILDLRTEAPLANGLYSQETGRTYWAHQCTVDGDAQLTCPFDRRPLGDLVPNKEFDRLFKAAFPKAYKQACRIHTTAENEHNQRVRQERGAAAAQARLDAQPVDRAAEEQQIRTIQQRHAQGQTPEALALQFGMDLELVRAMLGLHEPAALHLAEDRNQQFRDLEAQGFTFEEILQLVSEA